MKESVKITNRPTNDTITNGNMKNNAMNASNKHAVTATIPNFSYQ